MSHHVFPWREAFLAALREVPVLSHACGVVGIDRSTAFRARQADEEFDQAVVDALEAGVDRAEQEAFRRAVIGFEEPVVDKGRLAYRYQRIVAEDGAEEFKPVLDDRGQPVPLTVRKHSDQLLALILKGRRKAIYSERIEQTGANGAPLIPVDEGARAARAAALIALAEHRKALDDASDLC